jgi:hypothetical protein
MRGGCLSSALVLLSVVLIASSVVVDQGSPPSPPSPPPLPSFAFDALFGDNMVLQREPNMAAVYGFVGANGTAVSVTVEG